MRSPYKNSNHTGRISVDRSFKCLVILMTCGFLWFSTNLQSSFIGNNDTTTKHTSSILPRHLKHKPLKIAYIGNSILFYNDSPGVLAAMMEAAGITVQYDACLRGGASFSTIHTPEFGCTPHLQISRGKPLTVHTLLAQKWDYVVLQDQTRAPSQKYTRRVNLKALNTTYVDPIAQSGATPIFLQTAAYSNPPNFFPGMTAQLQEGYQAYADLLTEELAKRKSKRRATVASSGGAYAEVYKTNTKLWERLYVEDGVHPSALGTYLQACVLYISILGLQPPDYHPVFFRKRTMLQLPTKAEAEELRAVAWRVAGPTKTDVRQK